MSIGQRVPMIDARERVSGRIDYVLNLKLPGMLVGRISPQSPKANKVSPGPRSRTSNARQSLLASPSELKQRDSRPPRSD